MESDKNSKKDDLNNSIINLIREKISDDKEMIAKLLSILASNTKTKNRRTNLYWRQKK